MDALPIVKWNGTVAVRLGLWALAAETPASPTRVATPRTRVYVVITTPF
jgi:hypothetical protein